MVERIERVFIGEDGKQRKVIKVMKDNSLVFIGYKGYAKDIQDWKTRIEFGA